MDAASLQLTAAQPGIQDPTQGVRTREKAREAAEDFEAVFIAQMMQPMFEGISSEAPFGGGQGEMVFRQMLIQEYGKAVAGNGGIGIADTVYREILRMQGLEDVADVPAP
jgi:Rod binding domain-containing protein